MCLATTSTYLCSMSGITFTPNMKMIIAECKIRVHGQTALPISKEGHLVKSLIPSIKENRNCYLGIVLWSMLTRCDCECPSNNDVDSTYSIIFYVKRIIQQTTECL